ncbi:MAG: glycosyltransferase family 4 protein [Actinomycetota bacterium]
MRITVLTEEFPPDVGGIGDHADCMAAELASRGAEISIVCPKGSDARPTFSVHGVVERWDSKGFPAIAAAVGATNPDVIVWEYNPFSIGSHGLAPRAGRLARALASHAPLVLILHELWFPWGRDGARGFAWALGQRLQAIGVLRAASRWIVTTEKREAELARFGHVKLRRVSAGPTIEPDDASGDPRRRWGIPRDAFVIAHLGSAGPGRDLAPVYDAIARLGVRGIDARLLLAGNAGPLDIPSEVAARVVVTGTVARADLSAALRAADVYFHADPAGPAAGRHSSLLSALAHGIPVVAYRGPDAAPQLADGVSVRLIERGGERLTGTLMELAAGPAARRRIGEAGREVGDRFFSWRRIGDDLLSVFQERL